MPETDVLINNGGAYSRGLLRVRSVGQLEAEANAKQAEEQAKTDQQRVIDNLSAYLTSLWETARYAKDITITPLLLQCERQRRGIYDPEKLTKIRQIGGSEVFVRITSTKCLAMEAWIKDTLSPTDGKPWSIEPTPIPDLKPELKSTVQQKSLEFAESFFQQQATPPTPDVIQEFKQNMENMLLRAEQEAAKYAAERMESMIEDQLLEGGFQKAFNDFIHYLVTYPFGVLKGPVFRTETELAWEPIQQADGTVKHTPKKKQAIKMKFEAVSPYDIYMSPMAKGIQNGYLFEKIRMSRSDLLSLKGVTGYKSDKIDDALNQYGDSGLSKTYMYPDWTKATNELKQPSLQKTNSSDVTIDVLEFHGSVQGKYLKEWGMENISDENAEYAIWAVMVGPYVIKAELNPDPLGQRPYYLTSIEKMPETPYGLGIAQKMQYNQETINSCRRNMINNMAIASGPQVSVNTALLPAGEDITSLQPWKIHQYHDDRGLSSNPIQFFQPNNNADILQGISEQLKAEVDDETSVPRFEQGNPNMSGAGATARGLAMLMNTATKTIKQVLGNIDIDILQPLIQQLYRHNMQYSPDESVKGDMKVRVRGANELAVKEQVNSMRLDFLNMVMQNEQMMGIVGKRGVLRILREVVKGLDMPIDSLIPTDAELAKQDMEEQQMQMQQQQAQNELLQAQSEQALGRADKAQADATAKMAQAKAEEMQMAQQGPINPGQQEMPPLPQV